ncbi:MAG: hypothetical protein R3Y53_10170, partial [Bacillota bacterium]
MDNMDIMDWKLKIKKVLAMGLAMVMVYQSFTYGLDQFIYANTTTGAEVAPTYVPVAIVDAYVGRNGAIGNNSDDAKIQEVEISSVGPTAETIHYDTITIETTNTNSLNLLRYGFHLTLPYVYYDPKVAKGEEGEYFISYRRIDNETTTDEELQEGSTNPVLIGGLQARFQTMDPTMWQPYIPQIATKASQQEAYLLLYEEANKEEIDEEVEDEESATEDEEVETEDEESTPEDEESTPEQEESTPEQEEATPEQEEATPEQEEATPEKEESTPEKEEATTEAVQSLSDEVAMAMIPVANTSLTLSNNPVGTIEEQEEANQGEVNQEDAEQEDAEQEDAEQEETEQTEQEEANQEETEQENDSNNNDNKNQGSDESTGDVTEEVHEPMTTGVMPLSLEDDGYKGMIYSGDMSGVVLGNKGSILIRDVQDYEIPRSDYTVDEIRYWAADFEQFDANTEVNGDSDIWYRGEATLLLENGQKYEAGNNFKNQNTIQIMAWDNPDVSISIPEAFILPVYVWSHFNQVVDNEQEATPWVANMGPDFDEATGLPIVDQLASRINYVYTNLNYNLSIDSMDTEEDPTMIWTKHNYTDQKMSVLNLAGITVDSDNNPIGEDGLKLGDNREGWIVDEGTPENAVLDNVIVSLEMSREYGDATSSSPWQLYKFFAGNDDIKNPDVNNPVLNEFYHENPSQDEASDMYYPDRYFTGRWSDYLLREDPSGLLVGREDYQNYWTTSDISTYDTFGGVVIIDTTPIKMKYIVEGFPDDMELSIEVKDLENPTYAEAQAYIDTIESPLKLLDEGGQQVPYQYSTDSKIKFRVPMVIDSPLSENTYVAGEEEEEESGSTEGGSTEGGSTEGGSTEDGSTEDGSTEGGTQGSQSLLTLSLVEELSEKADNSTENNVNGQSELTNSTKTNQTQEAGIATISDDGTTGGNDDVVSDGDFQFEASSDKDYLSAAADFRIFIPYDPDVVGTAGELLTTRQQVDVDVLLGGTVVSVVNVVEGEEDENGEVEPVLHLYTEDIATI